MAKKAKTKTEGEYEELILPDGEYAILHSATPRLYRNIALGFLAPIILLAAAALFFVSPKASIVVVVKPRTLSLSNIISVSSQPVGANTLTGLVASEVVSSTAESSPAGGESVPAKASGQVIIYNKTQNNQTLVKTTRLLSPDNVLFRINKTVTVPAGGQIEVEVEADQPGSAGEIGPAHFTIPGLRSGLQSSIYAESSSQMTGGERRTSSLTETDIENAQKNLREVLYKEAQKKLKEGPGAAYDSAEFAVDSEELSADQSVGAVVDRFKMTGHLKVVGVFYNQADLRQYLLTDLEASLGKGDRVEKLSPVASVKLENYDLAANTANLKAEQEVIIKQSIETLSDKSRVVNLTVSQAENYYKLYSSVSDVSIRLEPFWVKRIPKDVNRIEIGLINGN